MSAEKAVIDLLDNTAAVTTVVSTRIYLNQVPVTAQPPYVRVRRLGEDTKYRLSSESPMQMIRLEITSAAPTIGAAMDLAVNIKTALSLQSNTANSVTAEKSFLTNTFTSFDQETQLHRVIQDYEVFYTTS